MNTSIHIKRGTFITEQGFVQVSLMFLCCIGIPLTVLMVSDYNLNKFLQEVFSSILTSIFFVLMISAPILAFLVVIIGYIFDYYSFKRNPSAIKAMTLTIDYVILSCNNSNFDKILKMNEIKQVTFNHKQSKVINPRSVKNGFKFGGYALATALGSGSSSKITYEVEIIITDKNDTAYNILIPAKFSNKPYSKIQEIKDFFRYAHVSVFSNL